MNYDTLGIIAPTYTTESVLNKTDFLDKKRYFSMRKTKF